MSTVRGDLMHWKPFLRLEFVKKQNLAPAIFALLLLLPSPSRVFGRQTQTRLLRGNPASSPMTQSRVPWEQQSCVLFSFRVLRPERISSI